MIEQFRFLIRCQVGQETSLTNLVLKCAPQHHPRIIRANVKLDALNSGA